MPTRKNAARKVQEDLANTRVQSHDNRSPHQEQSPQGDQAPVFPPAMTDGEIRSL